MHTVVLNYRMSNKQINIEHNFIKYSYSYIFRRHEVMSLAFRTCKGTKHPVGSQHVAVGKVY